MASWMWRRSLPPIGLRGYNLGRSGDVTKTEIDELVVGDYRREKLERESSTIASASALVGPEGPDEAVSRGQE